MAETERGKTVITAREADVKRMTQARNQRESQLQDLREEVLWLRQKAGIKPGEGTGIDLTKLRLKGQVELDQLRAQVCQRWRRLPPQPPLASAPVALS